MSPEAMTANHNAMEHLTEFELDEVLLGDASPVALAHLDSCKECNSRLGVVAQPLATFREASLAWAEQRSAAMPMPVVAALATAQTAASEYVSGHLSDDQLDAVLIEGASPAAATHLADCNPCTVRLDAVAQPVASFQAVTLAWSERRSATLPLREESFGRAASRNWGRRYGWVAATAAAVAVAIAVPMHYGVRQPAQEAQPQVALNNPPAVTVGSMQPAVVASTSKPADATPARPSNDELRHQRQIDADNQMLAAIDHELDASQATLASFGVDVSTSSARPRNRVGKVTQE